MPVDQRFFQIIDGMTAHDLAARLGASIHGGHADQIITGVAPLALAAKGDVTYQTAGLATDDAPGLDCINITTAEIVAELDSDQTILIVDHPRRSFASALGMIVLEVKAEPGKTSVDRSAQIHPESRIRTKLPENRFACVLVCPEKHRFEGRQVFWTAPPGKLFPWCYQYLEYHPPVRHAFLRHPILMNLEFLARFQGRLNFRNWKPLCNPTGGVW